MTNFLACVAGLVIGATLTWLWWTLDAMVVEDWDD